MGTMNKLSAILVTGILASAAAFGAGPAKAARDAPELARAAASLLNLEIIASCADGHAVFKIRNAGESWPETGTFSVFEFRRDGPRLVAKRRMRLIGGQRASFRIGTSGGRPGRLGIWIKPSWYERSFAYDATVACK